MLAERYLTKHTQGTLPIEIVRNKGLRLDTGFWHIPVRMNADIPRRSHYYDALADTEIDLADTEHIEVLFVPTG